MVKADVLGIVAKTQEKNLKNDENILVYRSLATA
jgi:hypothetical protein